jgi:hypothetical protein
MRISGLARFLQTDPDSCRTDLSIVAQRNALFLATEEVLPEPTLRLVGRHFEVEATAVGEAHTSLVGRASGIAALGVGERHGEQRGHETSNLPLFPVLFPLFPSAVPELPGTKWNPVTLEPQEFEIDSVSRANPTSYI